MKKRIITAALLATIGGIAALADPMSEAKFQGGYNKAEDRFSPAEINFVGKNLVSPEATLDRATVIIHDDLFVSKAAFDKLEKRVAELEKEVFGGPPKRYGF